MYAVKLLFKFFLWLMGWKIGPALPDNVKKYVIVVAPHTSNWDFLIGLFARRWLNLGKAGFLIKKEWTESVIGFWIRAAGGIGVDRNKNTNIVDQVVEAFNQSDNMGFAVTPEGTRGYVDKWKTGFYQIAIKANVPLALGYIDYGKKEVGIGRVFYPTGNMEADLEELYAYFGTITPRHPELSNLHRDRVKKN